MPMRDEVGWHGDPGDAHSILPLNVLQWSIGDTLVVTQRTVLSDGVQYHLHPSFLSGILPHGHDTFPAWVHPVPDMNELESFARCPKRMLHPGILII